MLHTTDDSKYFQTIQCVLSYRSRLSGGVRPQTAESCMDRELEPYRTGSFLSRLRNGSTVYRSCRQGFSILSLFFIAGGVFGLFGIGENHFGGAILTGLGRTVTSLLFILLGILFGALRLLWFRDPVDR